MFGNPVVFYCNTQSNIIDLVGADVKKLRIRDGIFTNARLINPIIEGVEVDRLKAKEVYWEENAGGFGLNQLANPKTLSQFNPTLFRNQGASISISKQGLEKFIVVGAPYEPAGGDETKEGGVGVYKSALLSDYALQDAYLYQGFTTNTFAGVHSDISEDGKEILLTVANGYGDIPQGVVNINVMRWSGSTYVPVPSIDNGGYSCKIGTDYVITGGQDNSVKVFRRIGSGFDLNQTLVAGTSTDYPFPYVKHVYMSRDDTRCYYFKDAKLAKWQRTPPSTVWNLISPNYIGMADMVGLFVLPLPGKEMILYSSADDVTLFINGSFVAEFTIPGVTQVTCNTNHLFMYTSGKIYIAQFLDSTWKLSDENTNEIDFTSGVTSMACNSETLVLGRRYENTYGSVSTYDIVPLPTGVVKTNQMFFSDPPGKDLTIRSNYGSVEIITDEMFNVHSDNFKLTSNELVLKVADVDIVGTVSANNLITVYGGSAFDPAINIAQTDSGLFYESGLSLVNDGFETIKLSASDIKFFLQTRASNGSANRPAYSFSGSVNTGLYFTTQATQPTIAVSTGGLDKMIISTDKINTKVATQGFIGTQALPGYAFESYTGNGMYSYTYMSHPAMGLSAAGIPHIILASPASIPATNFAKVYIGGTTSLNGARASLCINQAQNYINCTMIRDSTTPDSTEVRMLQFLGVGGSDIGSIKCTSTTTKFETVSDYRLKKNVVYIENVLDKINQLKPCTYQWKSNNSDGSGFIAHELKEVVPDAVSGIKDGMNGEYMEVQSVDYSRLVYLLTAGIKDLIKINNDQNDKITFLTNNYNALVNDYNVLRMDVNDLMDKSATTS